MNRPAKHSESDFLAAAAALFAEGGIEAVTMSRVARSVGAPSGSAYHRFAGRPALLHRLWQTSEEQFEIAFLDVMTEAEGPAELVAAVVAVVDWCRNNLNHAIVLQSGPRELLSATWPESAQDDHRRSRRRRASRLAALTADVGRRIGLPPDEVEFAILEVPLAAVRPYLLARRRPPAAASDLAERVARRILGP